MLYNLMISEVCSLLSTTSNLSNTFISKRNIVKYIRFLPGY